MIRVMHPLFPTRLGDVFRGAAEVVKPTLVVPEDGTFLIGHPGKLGDVIRQVPKAVLTLALRILGKTASRGVAADAPCSSGRNQHRQHDPPGENRLGLQQSPSCVRFANHQQLPFFALHPFNYRLKVAHDLLPMPASNNIHCRFESLGPANCDHFLNKLDLLRHQIFEPWKLRLLTRVIHGKAANGGFALPRIGQAGIQESKVRLFLVHNKSPGVRFDTLHREQQIVEVPQNFVRMIHPLKASFSHSHPAIRGGPGKQQG